MFSLSSVPDHIRPVIERLCRDAEERGYIRGKADGQSEVLNGLKAVSAFITPPAPLPLVQTVSAPVNFSHETHTPKQGDSEDFDMDALLEELFGGQWSETEKQEIVTIAMIAIREAAEAQGFDPEPMIERLMALVQDHDSLHKVMMGHPVYFAWVPEKIAAPRGKYQYRARNDKTGRVAYGAEAERLLKKDHAGGDGQPSHEEVVKGNKDYLEARTAARAKVDDVLKGFSEGKQLEPHEWEHFSGQLQYLSGDQLQSLRKGVMQSLLQKVKGGQRKEHRIQNLQDSIRRVIESVTNPQHIEDAPQDQGQDAAAQTEVTEQPSAPAETPVETAAPAKSEEPAEVSVEETPTATQEPGHATYDDFVKEHGPAHSYPAEDFTAAVGGPEVVKKMQEEGKIEHGQDDAGRHIITTKQPEATQKETAATQPEPESTAQPAEQPKEADAGASIDAQRTEPTQDVKEPVKEEVKPEPESKPAPKGEPKGEPEVKSAPVQPSSEPDGKRRAEIAAKVDAAVNAENDKRRRTGKKPLSGDEKVKFREAVKAKLATPEEPKKPAPTADETEKAQEQKQREALASKTELKPIDPSMGRNRQVTPKMLQASDGKWYLPHELEETQSEEPLAGVEMPQKVQEGLRYGDDNAEVKGQDAISKAMEKGQLTGDDYKSIAESTGLSESRVKHMHQDIIATNAEDSIREITDTGKKPTTEDIEQLAKKSGVPTHVILTAYRAVREQDAFVALSDLKQANNVTPETLNKVAKKYDLTQGKVKKLLDHLESSSQLGEPSDEPEPETSTDLKGELQAMIDKGKDADAVNEDDVDELLKRAKGLGLKELKQLAFELTGVREKNAHQALLGIRGKILAHKRAMEGQKA